MAENLQNYLGEEDIIFDPTVISEDPKVEELKPRYQYVANPELVAKPTTLVEDVGSFLVDQLNRYQEPFKGVWLVHESSKNGRLVFTLQKKHSDQYRVHNLDRLVMQLKVVPNHSLLRRFLGWLKKGN